MSVNSQEGYIRTVTSDFQWIHSLLAVPVPPHPDLDPALFHDFPKSLLQWVAKFTKDLIEHLHHGNQTTSSRMSATLILFVCPSTHFPLPPPPHPTPPQDFIHYSCHLGQPPSCWQCSPLPLSLPSLFFPYPVQFQIHNSATSLVVEPLENHVTLPQNSLLTLKQLWHQLSGCQHFCPNMIDEQWIN